MVQKKSLSLGHLCDRTGCDKVHKCDVFRPGQQISWMRDGYSFTGRIISANEDGTYSVAYRTSPDGWEIERVRLTNLDLPRISNKRK